MQRAGAMRRGFCGEGFVEWSGRGGEREVRPTPNPRPKSHSTPAPPTAPAPCTLITGCALLSKIITRDGHPPDHYTLPLRRLRNLLLRDALAGLYPMAFNRLFGNVDVNLLTRKRCFEDSYDC